MEKIGIVIVAGGHGRRMESPTPKQFLLLAGRPVLARTLERLAEALPQAEIVVVLPKSHMTRWSELCAEHGVGTPHRIAEGGATRFASVAGGLAVLPQDCTLIAVHDGVRPLVTKEMILRGVAMARRCGAVVPVVTPADSMRTVAPDGSSLRIDRSLLRAVQTPQIFEAELLRNAYRAEFSDAFTDDASVVESSGVRVMLYDGEHANIKITTPTDLLVAEALFPLGG